METKMFTVLMAVALIAFGGVGVGAAMPEDLIGWDTPTERAWIYAHHINDMKDSMERQGMNEMQVKQQMNTLMYRYQYKIEKYVKMYNYIMVTELSSEDEPCKGEEYVGTVNITYNGNVYEITGATFTWNCQNEVTLGNRHVLATATVVSHNETSAVLINIEVYVTSILIAEIEGPVTVDF